MRMPAQRWSTHNEAQLPRFPGLRDRKGGAFGIRLYCPERDGDRLRPGFDGLDAAGSADTQSPLEGRLEKAFLALVAFRRTERDVAQPDPAEPPPEELLGFAELLRSRSDLAEFRVGVAEGARCAGIATSLVAAMQILASRVGIRTLCAEVEQGTPSMLAILRASGFGVVDEDEGGAFLEKILDGLSVPRLAPTKGAEGETGACS